METGGNEDPLKLGLLSIVARAAFFNTFLRVVSFWEVVLSKGHLWQYVVQGHLNVRETGVRVS